MSPRPERIVLDSSVLLGARSPEIVAGAALGYYRSAISYLSRVLVSVDYHAAPTLDLSWLADEDDHPVMQTALAANAEALITDNVADFPSTEERNGVLFLDGATFLAALYADMPEARAEVRQYLAG